MDNHDNNIPENCDKILFAEDVVCFFMSHILDLHYQPMIASPYREFIYEAFNYPVNKALTDICHRINTHRNLYDIEDGRLSQRGFKRFAKSLRKLFFKYGFDAKFFLCYCVHLASLSTTMVNSIGLQEAGNMAVVCIVRAILKHDMMSGGWETLNITAEKMNSIEDYADSHTPDYEIALSPVNENLQPSNSEGEDSEDDAVLQNLDRDEAADNSHLEEVKCCVKVDNELQVQNVSERANSENVQLVENVKDEDVKDEDVNVEGVEDEDAKGEGAKDEGAKGEDAKGEVAKDEGAKGEGAKDEGVKGEGVTGDGVESSKAQSLDSFQSFDFCPTSSRDKNNADSKNDIMQNLIVPESENNTVPLKEKRSPKRDHRGSVITNSPHSSDIPSSSSDFPTDHGRNVSTSTLDSKCKIEQLKEDTFSFDGDDLNTSKKSKLT